MSRNASLEDIDENRALALFAPVELPSKKTHSRFMVRHFVRFLIGQGVAKVPPDTSIWASTKQDYEQYLRRQCGLSEGTIFRPGG